MGQGKNEIPALISLIPHELHIFSFSMFSPVAGCTFVYI